MKTDEENKEKGKNQGKKKELSEQEKTTTKEREKKHTPQKEFEKKEKVSMKKILVVGIFTLLTIAALYLKLNVNVDLNTQNLIMWLSLSIMSNIIILGLSLGTGIGIRIIKRFRQRILHHTGKYVNTILLTKNGTAKEYFKKVEPERGTFTINQNRYCRNPSLLFNYDKIPTYAHREGNPDPLNIWEKGLASQISNAEIDAVMNSGLSFDVKQWLEKNKNIVATALLIVIGACALTAFFGYNAFEMLRDGTYAAVDCKPIIAVIPPTM